MNTIDILYHDISTISQNRSAKNYQLNAIENGIPKFSPCLVKAQKKVLGWDIFIAKHSQYSIWIKYGSPPTENVRPV